MNHRQALEKACKGDAIQTPAGEIALLEDIEFAHKVAIVYLAPAQAVYKHGHEIGYMAEAAPAGTWILSTEATPDNVQGLSRARPDPGATPCGPESEEPASGSTPRKASSAFSCRRRHRQQGKECQNRVM